MAPIIIQWLLLSCIDVGLFVQGVSTTRRLFVTLEQLKQQQEELRTQLQNQTGLLQILVGRFAAPEEAVSQLPDSLNNMPCNSLDSLRGVDGQLSDRALRTSLVCN